MTTPICDFVKRYADCNAVRLHMPGHKGASFLGIENRDITEVEGADVLYSGNGVIAESQMNASTLFGSKKTLYSTEGSSLSIRAMIFLVSVHAARLGRRAKILAGRNAHKTFMSAIALLDVDVEWLYGDGGNILSCKIDPDKLSAKLKGYKELPTAIYITSPDYLGQTNDIATLARVCHDHGVLLIVDNAHGAYLRFLPEDNHPITLGADICCDSAHKTLPVLTGGGYLHIGECAPDHIADEAERAMSLFASTSPSYLIMQSLDQANLYLAESYCENLRLTANRLDRMKRKLVENGFSVFGDEKLKLTIAPKSYGYTGDELAAILFDNGFVCELSDRDHVVMMFTPEINFRMIDRFECVMLSVLRREPIHEQAPSLPHAERVVTVRTAILAPSKEIRVSDACGKILATPSVSCPPAVPILICGERIDEDAIKCLEYYGMEKVRVLI